MGLTTENYEHIFELHREALKAQPLKPNPISPGDVVRQLAQPTIPATACARSSEASRYDHNITAPVASTTRIGQTSLWNQEGNLGAVDFSEPGLVLSFAFSFPSANTYNILGHSSSRTRISVLAMTSFDDYPGEGLEFGSVWNVGGAGFEACVVGFVA